MEDSGIIQLRSDHLNKGERSYKQECLFPRGFAEDRLTPSISVCPPPVSALGKASDRIAIGSQCSARVACSFKRSLQTVSLGAWGCAGFRGILSIAG